ncbi:unnamed protein product [Didymodactylos carnosus]|uniref:Uncharacterized protein n=1 Tax=Didymodactylos carnosus TaxID=1234261 RepID=A0A815NI69_9BILA|nr:unnamed protein product [Didymodactylos carnosus]CAF4314151.1 unnamed protein product [Didymodactylos carnosus]
MLKRKINKNCTLDDINDLFKRNLKIVEDLYQIDGRKMFSTYLFDYFNAVCQQEQLEINALIAAMLATSSHLFQRSFSYRLNRLPISSATFSLMVADSGECCIAMQFVEPVLARTYYD